MPTSAEKRDKELHDRDRMFRRWLMWHAEQLAELQAGPWYAEISELLAFLNKMDLNGGDALIRLVKSQGWHAANTGVRYMILREIDKEQSCARARKADSSRSMIPFRGAAARPRSSR